jgi:hypothetical protein
MDIRRAESRDTSNIDLEPPVERPPGPASAVRRELLDDAASSSHDSPELLAFYAGLRSQLSTTVLDAPATPRDVAAGAAIDAKRDAYSGPYNVEGQTVSAPPMFHMTGGQPSQSMMRDLPRIVGSTLAGSMAFGQASPAQIVATTQKLIDAGKLPPGSGDVAARIKQMQWQYGVGIDCACFTRQGLAAVTGKSDAQLGLTSDLGMRGLDRNPHFAKVPPTGVRPGDVITLDPKPPETVGHNVIVRDRTVADDAKKMELGRHGPVAKAYLASPGPHHVIQVDSSWGAGGAGAAHGGYRRDTWIYDESTQIWGHSQPGTGVFLTSKDGPAELDRFHGAYRVKGG